MGLFYRWRKPAPADWVPGTATILASAPHGEPGPRESGGGWLDLQLNHFGYRTFELALAVDTEVHGDYETEGAFEVPRRAENTGWLAPKVQVGLHEGLKLPVYVDPRDRDRVRVDWPAFLAAPHRKGEQNAAAQVAYERRLREIQEADPKLQALVREDPADD